MGRFSWGIGATSREARGGSSSRKEELVMVEEERVGEGKVKEEVPSSYARAPKYMWLLGLGLTALFGCWMEAAPVRSSNAMWTNHLFSEYRPPRRVHMNLIRSRKSALLLNATEPARLWDPPSDNGWKPCLTPDYKIEAAAGEDNGYLQVMCTGGLFQLHICVSNVVAVAKLLNVTMVIPYFRESIVWKDSSQFHDIYDIKHFIAYFKDDVRIVRHLPLQYAWSVPEYYQYQCLERPNCLAFIPKHSTMAWYLANVPPILGRHGLAVIDGFDHKLTFEGLPSHVTKLRCRANFEGLRFVPTIQELGKRLVHRMKAKGLLHQSYIPVASEGTAKFPQQSAHRPWWSADGFGLLDEKRSTGSTLEKGGRYLGLHVRFQKDMIAHSACYYGGGRAEKRAVAAFRTYVWRNRVTKTKYKPDALRMNGSCPLTPEEIGLLLSGLGFTNNIPAYMAMKDLYGGQARLKTLKEMFPSLESKYTLATKKELKPFLPSAHKLAALDFIVSLNSDVFMSNAAGNFPNVLSGQRTFFGPRKSIHADKALLASLFANTSMSWSEFSRRVITGHESRLGAPTHRLPKYSMYRYPAPDCMCQDSTAAARENHATSISRRD